jgi:hypothetical protein
MYAGVKTWNPFKGCDFTCTYCGPTFQAQAKRQKHNCTDCYEYTPHCHPERLTRIPSAGIVFVAGSADISFCPREFTHKIIAAIVRHNRACPHKEYYLQSKRPEYLAQFLPVLPANVLLVTTLETNRDKGYAAVSKAPVPTERYRQFTNLDWPRKVVTVEPLLDFDLAVFTDWLTTLRPEYVWLGYNSRPAQVTLPEPEETKVRDLIGNLKAAAVPVRGKSLRGIAV